MTEKIPINGLKQSERLAAIWVHSEKGSGEVMPKLCRLLAGERINIAFMTPTGIDGLEPALCCVDMCDQSQAAATIYQDSQLSQSVHFDPETMGLLSLYPHQASLRVLGVALQALSDRGIAVHGLASSISALTFVITFAQLEQAAILLKNCMKLPSDTTPVTTEFKVRQAPPSI